MAMSSRRADDANTARFMTAMAEKRAAKLVKWLHRQPRPPPPPAAATTVQPSSRQVAVVVFQYAHDGSQRGVGQVNASVVL